MKEKRTLTLRWPVPLTEFPEYVELLLDPEGRQMPAIVNTILERFVVDEDGRHVPREELTTDEVMPLMERIMQSLTTEQDQGNG